MLNRSKNVTLRIGWKKIRNSHTLIGDLAKPLTALLIVIALTLFASNIIRGKMFYTTVINTQGTVKTINVGVYWDSNCSSPVSYIKWGNLEPGSTKNVTLFIRNEGDEVTNLFLTTENWNPLTASNFIALSWDYDSRALNPYDIVQVTLTLRVSPDTGGIGSFSFDIIIGAAA